MTRSERLLVPILALLATAAFFSEYLGPNARVHLFSDIELYHYPLQRYAFDALRQGRIPQWDNSMYCGIPFAGNIQAALFYPPAWLLYAANRGRPALSFRSLEYFAFAHIWLAFVLCYFWLRRRRLEILPCALGAGVFAFGGYLLWQIVHLGVVTAVAWLPLALWGLDDAADRRDWRPLWKTTLASALWLLAGYPPSWVAFCATAVIYGLAGPARWRGAAAAAGAVAASLLLAAAQVLPALEAQSSMFEQTRYTSETKSVILPFFVANWVDSNRSSPLSYLDCSYLYWGAAAAFALLWALRRRTLGPYARPLAVLAACLFLVLDPGHVVYYAIVRLPVLVRLLQSYNFLEGASAMAALLTAIALAEFLRAPASRPAKWLAWPAAAALAAWSARELRIWSHGGAFASGWQAAAETAVGVAIFGIALWALRPHSGWRRGALAAALLLFALCDYKVYGVNRHFNTRDGNVDQDFAGGAIRGINPAAWRAIQENRHFRVTSDGSPNSMEFRIWGLASPQGLDPLLPARYRERIEQWGGRFETTRVFKMDYRNDEMLQDLGVRYAISYRGAPGEAVLSASPAFRLVGPDDSFYRVYEYQRARPAYQWDGHAAPVSWSPERRAFRVNSERGGRFGLVESFLPGWQARVDGRAAPLERWRGLFQSVEVPAGEHAVVFEYRSRGLPLGGAVSLASLAGLAWVMAASRKTRAAALPPGENAVPPAEGRVHA